MKKVEDKKAIIPTKPIIYAIVCVIFIVLFFFYKKASLSIEKVFLLIIIISLFIFLIVLLFKKRDISQRLASFILILLTSICTSIYAYVSVIQCSAFLTGHWDLAGFDQAIWNTIKGRILDTTMYGHNFLGEHMSPMLIIFAPFYLIWQDPRMLLILQSIFLGLGAIPVFLIAKDKLKHNLLSLSFSFAYLFHPFLSRINLFEFHEICLAPFFLLFTFYFLQRRVWILYFIFLFLSLMVKEDISLIITALGIYSFFKQNKKIGLITFTIGILWAYLSISVLIPYIRKATETGGGKVTYGYFGRLGLGESQGEIIKNLILKPQNTLKRIFLPGKEKLATIILLILPPAFFSILSLEILIALPEIFLHFLSPWSGQYLLAYQYSTPIIPFAVISGIYGCLWLKRLNPFALAILIFTTSFLSNFYFSFRGLNISPQNPDFYVKLYNPDNHKTILSIPTENLKKYYQIKKTRLLFESLKKIIPENTPVCVQDNLMTHFSQRRTPLDYFPNYDLSEYIVFNTYGFGEWVIHWESLEACNKGLASLLKDNRFKIFFRDNPGYGGIAIFGKKEREEEIIENAKKVVKENPKSTYSHFILGSVYFHTNNHKKAKKEFETALNIDKQNTFAKDMFEQCKD
ncbi:MAG: DUF2079 domain-containing protein [bacterium]